MRIYVKLLTKDLYGVVIKYLLDTSEEVHSVGWTDWYKLKAEMSWVG